MLPGELRAGVMVALALAVAGAPLGVLWALVSPRVRVVITPEGPDLLGHETGAFFGADAVFLFVGLAAGLLAGTAVWLLRAHRGPLLLVAAVLGGLAGAVVMWQVGRHIGLAHYRQLLDHGAVGRQFAKPVDLRAKAVLLGQPFATALTYLVLSAWAVTWPGSARYDS